MTRIVLIVLCSAVRYAVLPVSILMLSGMMRPATADGRHTLTIYVEEGSPNGHVFVGISDGVQIEKWGWYTQAETTLRKLPGLVGCAGGLLQRDEITPYNVSQTYPISRHAYFVIKSQVIARQAGGEYGTASWSPFKHCGHFALDVASAASIDIPLESANPGTFAEYLRAHGGVETQQQPQFAGTWSGNNYGAVWNVTIRPAGTAEVQMRAPDGIRTENGKWSNCTLNAAQLRCNYKMNYHDQDKDIERQGMVTATLGENTVDASGTVDSKSILKTWRVGEYHSGAEDPWQLILRKQ